MDIIVLLACVGAISMLHSDVFDMDPTPLNADTVFEVTQFRVHNLDTAYTTIISITPLISLVR